MQRMLKILVLLTAPIFALLATSSLSIQAKLLQQTTSEFLEYLAGGLLLSSLFGFLLIQLVHKQLDTEHKQISYLSIAISTVCLLLSFGVMLFSQQITSLDFGDWGGLAMGTSFMFSSLFSIQEDEHKRAKGLMYWASVVFTLATVILFTLSTSSA